MRVVLSILLLLFLSAPTSLSAQQAPADFRWINFHAPADQDTIIWVTRSLEAEKWTAIREIGVQYDAALVVTTLRPTPQSTTNGDTFAVYSVSLTNHSVTALIQGVNLRLLDWMLFAIGQPRELGALYDDCNECVASTFFTAFFYDVRQHGWATRWMRGNQAVPLSTSKVPAGVALTQVYAILADPNGHELVATWSHFDYGDQKPAEDFLYQYDLDPFTSLDRTQILSPKQSEAMERRLCLATDAVSGLAHGQDSPLCHQLIKPAPPRRAR